MDPWRPSTTQTPVNREYLSMVAGGDQAFERELVESYLQGSPEVLSQLNTSVQTGDREAVARMAHTLKGSSRAIGAEAVGDVCEIIEHRAREEGVQEVTGAVLELERRYAQLSGYLRTTWGVRR
jgi:HPt (histidine-containing phosphotransfer) domain-containing protein